MESKFRVRVVKLKSNSFEIGVRIYPGAVLAHYHLYVYLYPLLLAVVTMGKARPELQLGLWDFISSPCASFHILFVCFPSFYFISFFAASVRLCWGLLCSCRSSIFSIAILNRTCFDSSVKTLRNTIKPRSKINTFLLLRNQVGSAIKLMIIISWFVPHIQLVWLPPAGTLSNGDR